MLRKKFTGKYAEWDFLNVPDRKEKDLKPSLPEEVALRIVGTMPMKKLLSYTEPPVDLASFATANDASCGENNLIEIGMQRSNMSTPLTIDGQKVDEVVLRRAIYKVIALRGYGFAKRVNGELPATVDINQCRELVKQDVDNEPLLQVSEWIDTCVKKKPEASIVDEAMAMAPLLLQEHLNNLQQAFKGAKYSIEEKTKRHWESAKNWTIDNFQVLDENNKRINVWDINIPDGTSVSGRLSIYYDEVTKEAKIFDKTKEILAPFNNEVIDVLSYVGLTKEAWLPAEVIKLHRVGVGMFGDPVLTKLGTKSEYQDKHLLTPQEVKKLGLTTEQINEYLDDKGGYYLLKQDSQATTAITMSKLWEDIKNNKEWKDLPPEKQNKLTDYFKQPMKERFDIAKNEQNDKKDKLKVCENTINEVLKPLADAVDLAEEDFDGFLGVDALITDGLIKTAFTGEGGEFEDNLAKNLVLGIKADLFTQAYKDIDEGKEFGKDEVEKILNKQKLGDILTEDEIRILKLKHFAKVGGRDIYMGNPSNALQTVDIHTKLIEILQAPALCSWLFGKQNITPETNEIILKNLALIGTPNKDLHLKFYNELRGKFNDYDAWGQNKSMGGERIFAQVNNLYKEFISTAVDANGKPRSDINNYDKYLQDKIFSYLAKAYKDNTPTSLHVQDLKANPQEKLLTYEEYLIEQGGKVGESEQEKEEKLKEAGKNALQVALIKHFSDFNIPEYKEHLWGYVEFITQNSETKEIIIKLGDQITKQGIGVNVNYIKAHIETYEKIIDEAKVFNVDNPNKTELWEFINEISIIPGLRYHLYQKLENDKLAKHIETYEKALLQVENFNNDIDDIKNKTELWEYVKNVVDNGLEEVVIAEAREIRGANYLEEYIKNYKEAVSKIEEFSKEINEIGDKATLWRYVKEVVDNDLADVVADQEWGKTPTLNLVDHIETYEKTLLQVEKFNNDIDDIKNKTELWEYVKNVVDNGLEEVVIEKAGGMEGLNYLEDYINTYKDFINLDLRNTSLDLSKLNSFIDYGLESDILKKAGNRKEEIGKYIENYKVQQLIMNDDFSQIINLTSIDLETATFLVNNAKKMSGNFDSLTSLDIKVVSKLAESTGEMLSFNSLKSLNAEIATELAKFTGEILNLNGLESLDSESAKALAEFKGNLNLAGLKQLDTSTAKELASFKGKELNLSGLSELDGTMARALVETSKNVTGNQSFLRKLNLRGLKTIDESTAKALAKYTGGTLDLSGINNIDDNVLNTLGVFKGRLLLSEDLKEKLGKRSDNEKIINEIKKGIYYRMGDLTEINTEIAEMLVGAKIEDLDLRSVGYIDKDTAEILKGFLGSINLGGLAIIENNDVAEAFSAFKAKSLDLSGVKTINPEIAESLAKYNGVLDLSNLKDCSPESIEALAKFKGKYLDVLTEINEKIKQVLNDKKEQEINKIKENNYEKVSKLETIDKKTAKILQEALAKGDKPLDLTLNITNLNPEIAGIIGQCNISRLNFAKLENINKETMGALLKDTKIKNISLTALNSLNSETAEVLSKFQGKLLNLRGLTSLDHLTAQNLAKFSGKLLNLSGLTSLDSETAQALADYKGKLIISENLKTQIKAHYTPDP